MSCEQPITHPLNANNMVETLYGKVSKEVFQKAQNIKLLVCDVDGVFSDGRIYLGNNGEELKAFNTKDGFGIKALGTSGVKVAIITGRKSAIVANRMKSLQVEHIIQGEEDKLSALKNLAKGLNISSEHIAFIGDDTPDIPCINYVALGVAVQDAHPSVTLAADFTTSLKGGFGAVRELCDLIMLSQYSQPSVIGSSL